MAQHDYDIANGSGLAVRSDLNDVLEAIATNNSGAAAPSVTFPNQWHFDDTAGRLKRRNSANTVWIPVPGLISGLKFLSDVDQSIDLSNPVNWINFKTGTSWTADHTITFDNLAPLGDFGFAIVNNSNFQVILANGIGSPLDITPTIPSGNTLFLVRNPSTGLMIALGPNTGFGPGGGVGGALGDLTDVGTAPPTAGHLIQGDGAAWQGLLSTLITGDFRGAGIETLAAAFSALRFITQVPVAGARGVADIDSGKTLIYTGAGDTWTFNNADLTAGAYGLIRNIGSGAITVSTDGVEKFVGTEPIPAENSATWEWDGTNLFLDVNA